MIAALSLGLLLQAAPFAPMGYPGAGPELSGRIVAICPLPATTDRVALVANEERLANRVRDARTKVTALQWEALACGRARLAAIGALSPRASHLMGEGTSWSVGAIDAALRSLAIDPTEASAQQLVALLAMADAEPDQLPTLAALMRRAVDAGARAPAVLRACSDFALRSGDSAGTRACAAAGLAAGSDSTWQLLRLTQQAFRDADTLGGMRLFEGAAAAARDSTARRDLEWQLQWFVTPAERAAWLAAPDSSRGHWVRDRLVERDVRDGRPPGSRLAEHFSRLEFVERNYRMAFPIQMRRVALGGSSVFLGVDGAGISTSATGWREYRRWQVDFDDRGVVYMRFGAPEKVVQNVPTAGAMGAESWRYIFDGTPMLVHFTEADFDGSSGNSTMAVGVVGEWQCGIDSWRCLLAQRGGPVPPEQIQRLREVDREYLAIATTKDDNSPRGQQPIHSVAQLFQLWDALSGEPLAVIAYAMRLDDLAVTRDSSGRESARVELALARWQPATAEWREDSLPGDFPVPARKKDLTHLTGFTTLPGVGGVSSWGLTASQADHRWGRTYANVLPNSTAALALSDLIIAPESRGLSWVHRGERIFISPGGALGRREPLHLYYQVRSDGAIADMATTIEVRSLSEGRPDSVAAIQMAFAGSLQEGITATNRLLDLSQLQPGSYLLEVRVAQKGGALQAHRTALIVLE